MAQKLTLDDDLDGTPIENGGGTIRFSIEGANYEVDLSASNTQRLHDGLEKYVSAGRCLRNSGGGALAAVPKAKKSDPQRLKAIREWANESGHEVSSRSRVPSEIVDAYDASH